MFKYLHDKADEVMYPTKMHITVKYANYSFTLCNYVLQNPCMAIPLFFLEALVCVLNTCRPNCWLLQPTTFPASQESHQTQYICRQILQKSATQPSL